MTDRAYIIIRTLEDKIAIADNNGRNTMFVTLGALKEILALLKEREAIKPTINEYGEAYCVCGENVGIIPSSKNLPSIRSKYCSECGRRMKWNG